MAKANEHANKTVDHLKKEAGDMQEKLRVIRFGGAGSRSRNVKEGRNIRRDVARILTELRARELKDKATIASTQATIASTQATIASTQATIASNAKTA